MHRPVARSAPRRPQPPPLVGRDRERALLGEQLAAAQAGAGSLVLIGGEAGIGKTALAEALCAEAAERGALALVGRCYDLTATPPYGPWLEVFARYPAGDDLPPLPPLLARRGRVEEVPDQEELFAQAREFLAAVAARRPLVLLLDDLHWADLASLALLRVVARDLAALSALVLVTYRAEEVGRRHPLYRLLPQLVREARAARLDPRRLTADDLRALVRARYPLPTADEARLVAYLEAHAEGNPFYTGELARALEEAAVLRPAAGGWALGDPADLRLPTLLRQVIDGRLARLGEAAVALLAVGAVIGQAVPLDLWCGVAGVTEEALLDVIERAAEAQVLDATPEGARFRHALLREALYEGLLPARRAGWHRRVGEALAATPRPDPDAVAHHFRRAGDARAAEWLIRAGERAWSGGAGLSAAERFEAALALLDARGGAERTRGWLRLRLSWQGHYADPRQRFGDAAEAVRLAAVAGDPALAAYALGFRGHLDGKEGRLRAALADLTASVAAFDALPPPVAPGVPPDSLGGVDPVLRPSERAFQHAVLALHLAQAGRPAAALAQARSLLADLEAARAAAHGADATEPDSDVDLSLPLRNAMYLAMANGLAHNAVGVSQAALGRPAEARRAFARSRAANPAKRQHWNRGWTTVLELHWLILPYHADDRAARRARADEAVAAFDRERTRRKSLSGEIAAVRLPLLALEGAWAEAGELASLVTSGQLDGVWQNLVLGDLGRLRRAQGAVDQAWRVVARVLPAGPDTDPGDTSFFGATAAQRLAAALALDAGDLPVARAWLAAHDRWLAWGGAALGQAEGRLGWAAYHRAAGESALAREHAVAALAHASEPRQPLALLAAHRALGELDTAAGHHADAAAHLDAALALADACAAPYERALTLLALAALRAAGHDTATAQALLAESRAICAPLDARPALARGDALVACLATAPPAPAPDRGHLAGLTAREVEVLRLVAQGLTNAAVAERLYVTPRTVNAHLTSVYTKLGVASRGGAIRVALDHGLR